MGYLAILPELLLIGLLVAVITYDRVLRAQGENRRNVGLLAAWGFFAILMVTLGMKFVFDFPNDSSELLWGGMIRHDNFTTIFRVIFLLAGMLTSLIALDVVELQHGEFFSLLITSTIGFSLMAASSNLVMLFVALETASISLYVLGGYATKSDRSVEAGIKYFVYGSFATAIMMYGMSLVYGLTGETGFAEVARSVLFQSDNVVLLVSAVFIVVGFGFKVSIVPFHFWVPDVYEGAPTAVTGFLSTASKAAGFAVIMRVFNAGTLGTPDRSSLWWAMLVAMCVVTMVLGNFLAIYQKNIKRMLAYSSIAQAGYVMIGLVTFTEAGSAAAMFYLLMYTLTNLAAFGAIILVSNVTGSDNMEDLYGLSRRSPNVALAMLFALLSLAGIPPTAGFFGKFFIFKAAVEAGLWPLAVIGILNAFVAIYYYLNVAKYMYLYRSDNEEINLPVPRAYQVALVITVLGILYLGFFPGRAFEWSTNAASIFFGS